VSPHHAQMLAWFLFHLRNTASVNLMLKRSKVVFASIAISLSVLTGCSQAEQKSTYDSVDELRVAFEKAGGNCSEWDQNNAVEGALESGNCSSSNVLSIYSTQEEAIEVAENIERISLEFGLTPHLLVGENWLVNDPDVALYQDELGGTLIQ
jgi:hypothetical protein